MAQLDPSRYKRLTGPLTYGQSDGLYWDGTNSRLVVCVADTVYQAPLHVMGQAEGDMFVRDSITWNVIPAKTAGNVLVGDGTDVHSVALSGAIASISAAGVVALSPTGLPASVLQIATGTIDKAHIIGTSAGDLSHASGYPVVAGVGAHNVPEFISAILIYDYAGQGYANGGNLSIGHSAGGSTVSGVVSAANSLGAAADKVCYLTADVPTNNALVEGAGLNICTSGAFTDAGASAGVLRYIVLYRVHATGL